MPTHPLWRPYDPPDLDELAASAFVGGAIPREQVVVVPPDPSWPGAAAEWIGRIAPVLGPVEHVGSTSVPGLWAKPVLDLVTSRDTEDESYLPALEAMGLSLRVREPGHRVISLRGTDPGVNLHLWADPTEPARNVSFRDWLRTHADDRESYAALKRELADQGFDVVMAYNNAKSGLIYDIYERIFTDDPEHPHDPRPRDR